MNRSLTATVVPTNDIRLTHNETTRTSNQHELKKIMNMRTKVSGKLKILGGESGGIFIEFGEATQSPVTLRIATDGKSSFSNPEDFYESDHIESIQNGGNAYNEANHLSAFTKMKLRKSPARILDAGIRRTILNIQTDTGIRSIGMPYPEDLSPFKQFEKDLNPKTVNISDHSLANVFEYELDHGHIPLLNPTSSKWSHNGSITANRGKAPGIAAGIGEIPMFLTGAIERENYQPPSGKYIIHPSAINDEVPVFANGALNPTIVTTLNMYGWQFSRLLYDQTRRKSELPCDIVISQGPSGGAIRIGDLWAFSSTPGYEPSRKLGHALKRYQELPNIQRSIPSQLTDFNIQDTSGCGDLVAAMQAHLNTARTDIRKFLADAPSNAETNERVLDVAEILYISFLMRIYALIVFHTKGTSLSHLAQPDGILVELARKAAEYSVETAREVPIIGLHPQDTLPIYSNFFDMDIALWKQNESMQWPRSGRQDVMSGVVKNADYQGHIPDHLL